MNPNTDITENVDVVEDRPKLSKTQLRELNKSYRRLCDYEQELASESARTHEALRSMADVMRYNGQVPPLRLTGMTLTDAVITVIGNADEPISPSGIRETLDELKFPYIGKTDLSLRIANELARLHKSGKIRRHDNSTYELVDVS